MEMFGSDSDHRWARFTCSCYYHVLDFSSYIWDGEEDADIEISCLPLDSHDKGFWDRLKIAFLYLIGKNEKRHSFWEFCLRREDIKPFKEFVASLPERATGKEEMAKFQAKQFNVSGGIRIED